MTATTPYLQRQLRTEAEAAADIAAKRATYNARCVRSEGDANRLEIVADRIRALAALVEELLPQMVNPKPLQYVTDYCTDMLGDIEPTIEENRR